MYRRTAWSDTNSLIDSHFWCGKFSFFYLSNCLFWFSIGSYVVDQGSGDGWFCGRVTSLRSVCGENFPNFEMLDARIASALNKIIQNSQFKKKVSLEEQKAQKEDWFLRGRQIAFLLYDHFRFELLALMTQYWTTPIYSLLVFMTTVFRNSEQDGMKFYHDKGSIRWNLYKLRLCESVQLKTVLELYEMEIDQKITMPNYQKLQTTEKKSIDQKLQIHNFDDRQRRIETGAVVKNRKGLSGVDGGKGICYQWKKRPVFARRLMQFPSRDRRSCAKTRTRCRHFFWANHITRSDLSRKRSIRGQK